MKIIAITFKLNKNKKMKNVFLVVLSIMFLNCSNKEHKKEIVVNETKTQIQVNNNSV